MSEAICAKPQEEYEDDFEKDLDWLISEEGRSEDQVHKALVHVAIHFLLHSWSLQCCSSCSPPRFVKV